MTNFRSAFPSRYLKPDDLGTTRPIVTIAHVEFADVGTGADTQRKLVVSFEDDATTFAIPPNAHDRETVLEAVSSKTWVLNKINAETLAEITQSEDFDQWAGHRVELYVTKVEYQGKRVNGLRCAAPKPTKKAGPRGPAAVVEDPTSAHDDADAPF